MRLSSVYTGKVMWALVYHVQPGSDGVELITNRFFSSQKKAMKWFNRKRIPSAYVEPEAVPVSGFELLNLQGRSAHRITTDL